MNLRDLIRSGASEEEIAAALTQVVEKKPKDGFAAAAQNESYLSMTKLGG